MEPAFVPHHGRGRRFAVGDVHACRATLEALLFEQIDLQRQDQLFMLGDYVNRGPDSPGVIALLMRLQREGYEVYPILGNHEMYYLKEQDQIDPEHQAWLLALRRYYFTDDYFFVHAGFNFESDDPLGDENAMIWARRSVGEPNPDFLQGRRVVHGHEVHRISAIRLAVASGRTDVPLDNGCFKALIEPNARAKGYGRLCALNLDRNSLLVQKNIDHPFTTL